MNIISKLNALLILTILIKTSLFGSKPVHGKFNLPLDKVPQIVLNDFDEEVIPVVLKPWITIFNKTEGVKILETYNEEYDEFIERQKKYTKTLANVSHVNFVKRQVQIENLLTSPFFVKAQETYVSKKSDFINKMVSFVFKSDYVQEKAVLKSLMNRHLEAWDLFMQPYYYYSFFDLMGMQAIGTVFFDQLQQYVIKHIYNNRRFTLPVLFEIFALDASMSCNMEPSCDFDAGTAVIGTKQQPVLREVFIRLLKDYLDMYPQEEIVKKLIEAEDILKKHNQLKGESFFTEFDTDEEFDQCELEYKKSRAAIEKIHGEINEKVQKLMQVKSSTSVKLKENSNHSLNLLSTKQVKQTPKTKTSLDLDTKFGSIPKAALNKLEIFTIDFNSEEEWNSFVNEQKVTLGSCISYKNGSHFSQEVFFNHEGQRIKGQLLFYRSHGKDTLEKKSYKIRAALRKKK